MTQTATMPTGQPQSQQDDQPKYIITDDDKARIKAIISAWKAYDGNFTKPLVPMDDMADDNVISNRIKQIVHTGVYFLFGKELEISPDEDAPDEVKQFIDDTWGAQEVRVPLLQKLGMNGANGRNAFLRIVPGKPGSGKFRLVAVDPSTVYIQTAPGDCETVMLYAIQYSCIEQVNGRPGQVFYREEITRIDPDGNASKGLPDDDDTWQVQHWTQTGQMNMEPRDGRWIAAGEPYIWPYPFAPMFHCQNLPKPNEAWGEPDITQDLIDQNNALNFVQSNIQKVNRIYAHAHVWASGIADTDISASPGHVTILPPDGKMDAVHYTSDLPNAIAFAHDLRSDMDEQSNVPAVATGRLEGVPRGNVSGIALELMFMPILKKTDTKRCTYGKMIMDVTQALLVLNHMSGDIGITLQWQGALPTDGLQQMQAAVLKKQIGVSNTTLLEEAGYDPDEEQERSQTEDALSLTNFSRGQGMPPQAPQVPGMQQDMPTGAPPPSVQAPGQSPFVGR